MTRDDAVAIWKKYNSSESLFHHALSVEAVMRRAAKNYNEDAEYWGIVGLLHDVDWERYPELHCKKAVEILKDEGLGDDMIHAIVSHGYGICSDVKPELFMEKMLFTIDELTGLVNATALMRPEKLVGISVKSVKKKWNTKAFAQGVNRDIIQQGLDMLSISREEIIQLVIDGMTDIKDVLFPVA